MASILKIQLISELFANSENRVQLDANTVVMLETNDEKQSICPISRDEFKVGEDGYIIINCRCRIKKVFSNFLLDWIEMNPKCPYCKTPIHINRDFVDLNNQNSLAQRIKAISFLTLVFTSAMITRALIGPKPIIITIASLSMGYGAVCGAFIALFSTLRHANEDPQIITKALRLGFITGATAGFVVAASIISAIEVPFQLLSISKDYFY